MEACAGHDGELLFGFHGGGGDEGGDSGVERGLGQGGRRHGQVVFSPLARSLVGGSLPCLRRVLSNLPMPPLSFNLPMPPLRTRHPLSRGCEQAVPLGEEVVGDGHGLAEHVEGAVRQGDVVAVALGHFPHAVEAAEEGHEQDDLGVLADGLLEVAADEVVVHLVGAAELDIGLDVDGIPALDEGVEEFVQADGRFGFEALAEVVALEELADGHAGGELEDVGEGHLVEPLAVPADFELFGRGVEDFAGLGDVGFGVGTDILGAEHFSRFGAAGGVADAGGEVADDEDGLVAEVLELAELAEDDGVAEVDVGCGGVHAELDAEGFAVAGGFFELMLQFGVGVGMLAAGEELGEAEVGGVGVLGVHGGGS